MRQSHFTVEDVRQERQSRSERKKENVFTFAEVFCNSIGTQLRINFDLNFAESKLIYERGIGSKTADTLKARALLVNEHCTALPYRQAPRAEMGLTG